MVILLQIISITIESDDFFSEGALKVLWTLDLNINYYIKMINIYHYLSKDVFDTLLNKIQKNICNSVIRDQKLFLDYFEINYKKINKMINSIVNEKIKKEIQDSLLFFRPFDFKELYEFMNILINMNFSNKNLIIESFININKKLINEENIKFITNKINLIL